LLMTWYASCSPDIWIGDDGTLDTVVIYYRDKVKETHRYNSEYRFSFKNDDEFLTNVFNEIS